MTPDIERYNQLELTALGLYTYDLWNGKRGECIGAARVYDLIKDILPEGFKLSDVRDDEKNKIMRFQVEGPKETGLETFLWVFSPAQRVMMAMHDTVLEARAKKIPEGEVGEAQVRDMLIYRLQNLQIIPQASSEMAA